MMTFCYNDQTSTKTAKTAAVFRHILAWIFHVCLTGLERFLQNIAHESVVTNFSSLYGQLIYSSTRQTDQTQTPSWLHLRSRPSGPRNNLPTQICIPKSAYGSQMCGGICELRQRQRIANT